MPKVIDANKNTIIEVAEKMIDEHRYSSFSCRQIASEAGIGVGTLYHFFSSKQEILNCILINNWNEQIEDIETETSLDDCVEQIYYSLLQFSNKYHDLWQYIPASVSDTKISYNYHVALVNDIKIIIRKSLEYNQKTPDEEILNFIAEAIIGFSVKGKDYHQVSKAFSILLN